MRKIKLFFFVMLILLMILSALYSFYSIFTKNIAMKSSIDNQIVLKEKTTNPIPEFWNLTEIQSIPLNITLESTQYVWDATYQKNFSVMNIYYTSQYWINNTILRIYGALVFPDNSSGQLGKVPGILAMHGIGGNHYQVFDLAYFLAAHNYTVIAIDFPGHGNSSGPLPTQEWIIPDLSDFDGNITKDLLNRTHFYLITRAAIRAIDVLLNQSVVDPTKIAMTGASYGGLTTIFASNVYWQKVNSAIPVIAAGDLDISFSTPYSLTHLIVNQHKYDIAEPPISDLFQYFDPIYYVNSSNNPATLYVCGTNDDFFPIETFNNTFYATHNSTKAMSMTPGGHHGILMKPIEGTILYWLNYTLFDGPAPPIIQISRDLKSNLFGSSLSITTNISCNATISKVILATHWEILGATWEEHEMVRLNDSAWTFELGTLPFTADLTYFVMVEIEGEYYILFSSYVWRDTLSTWFTIPFFILIGVGLILPIFYLMRRDYRKIKPSIISINRRKYQFLNLAQIVGIGTTEIIIAICLYLPLVVILPQEGALEISMATILTQFIDFLPPFAPIVFTILIFGFIFAMSKPILGGIINLIIPALLIILGLWALTFLGDLSDNALFAGIYGDLFAIGTGLILWLIMGWIQIGFGIFKRKYQKRLQSSLNKNTS